jgi:hypothetical protein
MYGKEYVLKEGENIQVNMKRVLGELDEDEMKHQQFTESLKEKETGIPGINALEAIEWTMNDLDMVALPFFLNVEPAKKIAEVYRSVFYATAKIILPFVAIQKKLRGEKDKPYRMPYLCLLEELGILKELKIDLQGIFDPERDCKK